MKTLFELLDRLSLLDSQAETTDLSIKDTVPYDRVELEACFREKDKEWEYLESEAKIRNIDLNTSLLGQLLNQIKLFSKGIKNAAPVGEKIDADLSLYSKAIILKKFLKEHYPSKSDQDIQTLLHKWINSLSIIRKNIQNGESASELAGLHAALEHVRSVMLKEMDPTVQVQVMEVETIKDVDKNTKEKKHREKEEYKVLLSKAASIANRYKHISQDISFKDDLLFTHNLLEIKVLDNRQVCDLEKHVKARQQLINECENYKKHLMPQIRSTLISKLTYEEIYSVNYKVWDVGNEEKRIEKRIPFFESLVRHYKQEENNAIKNAAQKDPALDGLINKYAAVDELQQILKGDKNPENALKSFYEAVPKKKSIIAKRRDSAGMTFLKTVAVIGASLFLIVPGIFAYQRLFTSKGEKVVNTLEEKNLTPAKENKNTPTN